jgi:2-polyprenyl-3-methyl-5-hydroxy-6-metoxy-1,4-benzoquinol methylase
MLDVRPDSKGNHFRAARVAMLRSLIDRTLLEKPKCNILDVGGTYNFWHTWRNEIDWTRTSVTCVNLDPSHASGGKEEELVKMIQGNACDLSSIADREYDILFSNSVIEHVGQWRNMVAMANEVKRVSKRYLVQTPYFWFPIEPHARTPFLHWIPQSWAYRIVMARKCGFWSKAGTVSQAVQTVQSAQMIDYSQFKELFGDAKIIRERLFGLTKSLIAIKE